MHKVQKWAKIHFLEYLIVQEFSRIWGFLESGYTLKPLFLPQSMSWLFLRARGKILNLRAIRKPKYYYSSSYSCIWILPGFRGHVDFKTDRRCSYFSFTWFRLAFDNEKISWPEMGGHAFSKFVHGQICFWNHVGDSQSLFRTSISDPLQSQKGDIISFTSIQTNVFDPFIENCFTSESCS